MELNPIERFIREIQEINEIDYGDFMRKANLCLIHLTENHPEIFSNSDLKVLTKMKKYIQFTPSWMVNSTRVRIILDANFINQRALKNELNVLNRVHVKPLLGIVDQTESH